MGRASAVMTPEGKRLLLAAAAKLAVLRGSPHALVLREVAREAGLNHNTFYRHFEDMESMLRVMAEDFAVQVRQGIREARANVKPGTPLSEVVVGWLFDLALENVDIFTVSLRELHGPAGPFRDVVRRLLASLAEDMCEDLRQLPELRTVEPSMLRGAVDLLIRNTAWLCLDYLEHPEQRQLLLDTAHEAFSSTIAGVIARSSQPK
ncbi:TetR family transcriptional regulator [Pseudomonas sp. XK-1]|uniref:TetR family transcriptional regulator n=1 Tax=Pseudomonas sp. XK-1 TaxID=3136019 RepID=UPI002D2FA64E|nr:TetR family transcriptional regulator [Pseudomonas sp.]